MFGRFEQRLKIEDRHTLPDLLKSFMAAGDPIVVQSLNYEAFDARPLRYLEVHNEDFFPHCFIGTNWRFLDIGGMSVLLVSMFIHRWM